MIKTRFAPSPTGHLHIGGARTALYAWVYARKHQGQFVLRIEDTDQERSQADYVTAILQAMEWLGLNCDQGPFYQSHRYQRYTEMVDKLLLEGKAYRCTCSKQRLEQLRETQLAQKEKPRYDGHCRELNLAASEQAQVIRFKTPLDGEVVFHDQVYGTIVVSNHELDDLVLVRSDGIPTYNFAVVVDDIDMQITHVIRGDDHINNTPRQLNLYHALGIKPPVYTHVPMILGPDGKRLSKRHGATSVMEYRNQGFLPQALLNYLVRLGWSHGDQEIFSIAELIELFDVAHLNKAPAAVNPDKLLWLNQHYLKTLPVEQVAEQLAWHMQQQGIDVSNGPSLTTLVQAQAERCKTLTEMAEKSRYFYQAEIELDASAAQKNLVPELIPAFDYLIAQYQALESWQKEAVHQLLLNTAEQFNLKLGKLAQGIRVALTGNTVSPPLDLTLTLLGKERALSRLCQGLAYMQQHL